MQMLQQDHMRKSRAYWLLLFSFFLAFQAEASATPLILENDTIILGGKTLIVEREVVYDSSSTSSNQLDPEEKERPRLKLGTWRIGFDVSGYAPIDGMKSKVDGYSSLNAFVGPDLRRGSGMGVGGHVERAVGRDGFLIHSGLAIDFVNGFNYTLDQTQLDDSLMSFASFDKNTLDQILLFRYDIGSETDTVEMTLSQEAIQTSWLRLPIGLVYEREINREFTLRAGIFADVRMFLNGKSPDIYLLPDRGSEPILYQTSELEKDDIYNRFSITPRLSIGGRFKMDRRWWFLATLNGGFPFNPMRENDFIEYRSILTHVNLGVQYHFGR